MRFTSFASLCSLCVAFPAAGQVYWNSDFESPSVFFAQNGWTVFSPPDAPSVNGATVDIGPPHNHVVQVQVDSSNQIQYPWSAYWFLAPRPGSAPIVTYDALHTFFKFDVQVSQIRPFHVRLEYSAGDTQDLDVDVNPAVTNSFQTFLVPLTAFTSTVYYINHTGFAPFPTGLDFGIHGDPNDPANTWPSAPDNIFNVDNIAYIIAPPLNIAQAGQSVLLSWPTNTAGFVLQQNATPGTPNWQTVTNPPVLNNGMNQVTLPATDAGGLYRLLFSL